MKRVNPFRHIITNRYLILLLSALLFSCKAETPVQLTNGYTVDSTIMNDVYAKLSPYSKQANAWLSYSIYAGDTVLFTTADTALPGLAFTTVADSGCGIVASTGIDDGEGFKLIFHNDSAWAMFYMHSNTGYASFRTHPQNYLVPELDVQCIQSKITLSKHVECTNGELIGGMVELESSPFYITDANGEHKVFSRLKAYFLSEPLPIINKQYKTLQKQ
ncbi:MAG TPA: hypothetical protein VK167_09975 [Flavipsychrobacter sp.]|nr:hypothetical protein [Flavipsychrobacter sp.]